MAVTGEEACCQARPTISPAIGGTLSVLIFVIPPYQKGEGEEDLCSFVGDEEAVSVSVKYALFRDSPA